MGLGKRLRKPGEHPRWASRLGCLLRFSGVLRWNVTSRRRSFSTTSERYRSTTLSFAIRASGSVTTRDSASQSQGDSTISS